MELSLDFDRFAYEIWNCFCPSRPDRPAFHNEKTFKKCKKH